MNITFEWLKSESGDAWLRNAPHEEIEAALVSASGAIDPFDWEASQARAILGLACRGEFIWPLDLDLTACRFLGSSAVSSASLFSRKPAMTGLTLRLTSGVSRTVFRLARDALDARPA